MPESALPIGVHEDTFVLLIGTVAHQHLIVNTVCGEPMYSGNKTRAGKCEAFCATCFAPVVSTVYGGSRHRAEASWNLRSWFYRTIGNHDKYVGIAKVKETK